MFIYYAINEYDLLADIYFWEQVFELDALVLMVTDPGFMRQRTQIVLITYN